MAESSFSSDNFRCSICQDLLKDPVAIPCGHSYCMSCISGYWDQDDHRGVYSCPQCRRSFTPRPALGKNFILAEMVENLRKRKLQAARPAQCYSESGDVECDICTGRKNKAIKSCLVCLNSYCQNHFERHEEFHSRKRHKVTDATVPLKEMICPQHDKLLEIYCRTDQRCICMLCMVNEHKPHETVLAAEERAVKQKHLKETLRNLQQKIQEREKELAELGEVVESHKRSAQAAIQDSEAMFTEIITFIKRSCSEVTQLIRDQEKAAVSQTKGRLERLKQEIDDMRKRDTELNKLSHTDHDIFFLQSFQSLSVPPRSTDSASITSPPSFDKFIMFVSQLKESLQQAFKEDQENIFHIERMEGADESEQPPQQQLVDEPTLQWTSWRQSKRRYTEGQPSSVGGNSTLHPHGSLAPLLQSASSLELTNGPVDDAIPPILERILPVRQLKLPTWSNVSQFDLRMSPPELKAE